MELMRRRRELLIMDTSGLPLAFRKVEYIQSAISTYIYTGVQLSHDVDLEMEIRIPDIVKSKYLLGDYHGNDGSFFLYITSQSKPYFQTAYGCAYNNTIQLCDTEKHIFKFSISDGLTHVYCDGAEILQRTCNSQFPERSIYVAGSTMSGSVSCNTYWVHIARDGKLIRNFIPCIRKSDNKPGMYDTATKQFFTNAGTGEFIIPA